MARARIVRRLVVSCAVALASSALPAATHPDTAALQQASAPVLAADNVQRLRDEIKAVEEILPRLVDRAAALYLLADHYARLGEHAKALPLLKQCVALNGEFDPARVKAFARLQSDPEFRDLVERARRQNPPCITSSALSRVFLCGSKQTSSSASRSGVKGVPRSGTFIEDP
jgi:tetratricopeptide (TPR) repeat protein